MAGIPHEELAMAEANLFGVPQARKRKSRKWTPEGVTIWVYSRMFIDPVKVVTPINGNKLETKWAAVDTDYTLHLVAESEQFGLNAVSIAKRLSKAGYRCRCYIGTIDDMGCFHEVAAVVKRTAAEKRAMKKLGIRN